MTEVRWSSPDHLRARVVLVAAERVDLEFFAAELIALLDLLFVGYLVEALASGYDLGLMSEGDDRRFVSRYIAVASLSFNSPLEIVLEAVGGGVIAVKGVMRLMHEWEDWRVRRAQSNYSISVYKFLGSAIDSAHAIGPGGVHVALPMSALPSDTQVRRAAEVFESIHTLEVDSDSDRQQDAPATDV